MKYLFALLSLCCMLAACNSNGDKQAANTEQPDGESLFKTNCASCHMPTMDMTGPALKGARQRWPDKTLLYEFVKDPTAVINKNAYARDLQKKFGSMMTPSQLTNAEIDAILNYCDAQ